MPFRLLRPAARAHAPPSVPAGQRLYAIGDVHGRRDLLDRLLAAIEADNDARPPAATSLILLGDLIDRGPDAAGVIERVLGLRSGRFRTVLLMGNHEEALLRALDGGEAEMRFFARIGGQETILSYGVSEADYLAADYEALRDLFAARLSAAHRDLLEGMERYAEIGDYLFVHAGILPGVPLERQRGADLRWIRDRFLLHEGDHGRMVVHGHTISDEVDERPNRIGIDTGAFATGVLTALGLEGRTRWFLDTRDA